MHNMLVITFDSEAQALEGANVLWKLHEDLSTVIFSLMILHRTPDGAVKVLRNNDKDDLGIATGALAGGLMGLLGGPIGVLAGAAVGAVSGSVIDHWDADLRKDFLGQVESRLSPGKFCHPRRRYRACRILH